MIPRSISRPFGRSSPQLSEVDLAKLIDRTIALAVAGHHELGFATVSIDCSGRKRTTFIDGSSCQVSGEVCIAQRQDGITACIDTPSQGNGMTVQSITFSAPVCVPATGWYILDSLGYLYRIPADLLVTVPYWPQAALPSPGVYDLVRSDTWARLMCAADLDPAALNGDGDSEWFVISVEGVPYYTVQLYDAAIGGLLTHLETVPGFTDSSGQTIVAALTGRWSGVYRSKGTTTTVTLSQQDVNASALAAGQEYKALHYAYATGTASLLVGTLKGVKAAAGAATTPDLPSPLVQIALGVSTVAYGGTVTTVSMGTTTPINLTLLRTLGSEFAGKWYQKGLLQRDADAPNAGTRHVTLTLPAAGTNVATGNVRIAFGYPLAYWVGGTSVTGSELPPFAIAGEATAGELAARDDYDMALVYPCGLGIEYAPYHLNIAGPDIATPDASDILSTIETLGTRQDTGANLLVLPNNELALSRPFSPGGLPTNPQRFDRYRVRPAPSEPLTVALSQAALGVWPIDENEWTERKTYQANPWLVGDTSITLQSGSFSHGKPVPCVLWQMVGAVNHWTLDATAKHGQVQEPTAGTATIAFDSGGGAQAPDGAATPYITILGPDIVVAYGWTFSIGDDESALSPLTETALSAPSTSTYRRTLTVPLGPTGTTKRSLYRFAYDRQDYVTGAGSYESPWLTDAGAIGAVYDRMMVWLGEIGDNVTTEYVDIDTVLTFSGQRPPQPFIGPAGSGITMDIPGRPIALPPLNL
ncbi:MAG TPA: hypothetical protein DCQ64_19310 [Candidatus Rokubacteria bacterium]|nr:hypothetical protein [Candidatus Rokubacteria bacterium]